MTVQTRKLSTLNMPWPPAWDDVFGTPGEPRPLIVEIGFGYGHMLFHLAEQHPDAHIIGVEIASKPIETVERRLLRRGLENVRVIYGHAETFLHHMLQPASLSAVHVNFPDPWFKSGHAHRRLMQRDTLDAIVSRLRPGGMFYLATDIDAYAEMSHELLVDTPGLTNQFSTPWADEMPGRVVTKYERKAVQEGRSNKYFAYQRNDTPAPPVPVITEAPMPNAVFSTSQSLSALVNRFQRHTASIPGADVHISIMSAFVGKDSALFEVYVKEPTVEQHMGFLVVPRQGHPNEYTLKLASIGYPRPTDGVHYAAAVLVEQIRTLAPDVRVLHHKIRYDMA